MHSKVWPRAMAAGIAVAVAGGAVASSHREAPFISQLPKVDATDFYMFNSYETGRGGYVTLIANYQPFESPQGGPNYFPMDPNALYEIMIDNNGDAKEELTFQFRFTNTLAGLTVPVGSKTVPVPQQNIGPVSSTSAAALNTSESYTVTLVRGDRRTGAASTVTDASTGGSAFSKPYDNVGTKTFPAGQNYATYASTFIHTINIPGCMVSGAQATGRVFVGQRQDPFVVNLGEVFDLVNIKYPAEELYTGAGSARSLAPNSLAGLSVTSIALEVPAACLTAGTDPVIGGWTTASLRQASVLNPVPQSSKSEAAVGPVATPIGPSVDGGAWQQVSRLGSPLVNELIIGLPDKDRWNATPPVGDAQFNDYVTNPSLPVILQTLFGTAGVKAPNVYPRADLVEAFATGVPGLNKPANLTTPAEMLRLNTSTPVTAVGQQSDLGVLPNVAEGFPNGDPSGFPNGRRPIDDVVDIELRVAMGVLLQPYDGSASDPDPTSDASRQLHYTDGAEPTAAMYLNVFPYLNTPAGGAPTSAND